MAKQITHSCECDTFAKLQMIEQSCICIGYYTYRVIL